MLIPAMIYATDSRPVAEEVIGRLGLKMSPAQLLDNLTIEQDENMPFLILTYKGTDPQKAQQIVNTVGKVSSERGAFSVNGKTARLQASFDRCSVACVPTEDR